MKVFFFSTQSPSTGAKSAMKCVIVIVR